MAWRSSGASNAELIANMRSGALITAPRVFQALMNVDRANYCPTQPYQDSPQSIGWGATISAPHMHAHAAENLLPFLRPGAKVLDVGSGSGYTLALFHQLVKAEPSSKVVGVDHMQTLVDQAHLNLEKDGLAAALASGQIVNVCADGREGCAQLAPFDAIHVGAAASNEVPKMLIDQLKAPGRMFIPVEDQPGSQNIYQVDKAADGAVTQLKICGVRYVPLTDADSQWRT